MARCFMPYININPLKVKNHKILGQVLDGFRFAALGTMAKPIWWGLPQCYVDALAVELAFKPPGLASLTPAFGR